MSKKAAMRQAILLRRDGLALEDRAKKERHIANWIQRWLASFEVGTVLAYWPIRSEVDIRPAVEWAWSREWTVAFPKVEDGRRMKAIAAAGWDDFRPGAFGIPEPDGPALDPAKLTAVLVPGAAFDRFGNRLGYGQGFYDRFLPAATGAQRAGVAFAEQWVDRLPSDPHDVPMHVVITESGIWCVKNGRFAEAAGGEGETGEGAPAG